LRAAYHIFELPTSISVVVSIILLSDIDYRFFTNRKQGIEWLVENQGGITPDTVRAMFDFHDCHKKASVPHLA